MFFCHFTAILPPKRPFSDSESGFLSVILLNSLSTKHWNWCKVCGLVIQTLDIVHKAHMGAEIAPKQCFLAIFTAKTVIFGLGIGFLSVILLKFLQNKHWKWCRVRELVIQTLDMVSKAHLGAEIAPKQCFLATLPPKTAKTVTRNRT